MQTLLLPLALLSVAATSDGNVVPSIDRYLTEIKSLRKLPDPQCFKFGLYVSDAWFRAAAYDESLGKYPGQRTTELDEKGFRNECTKRLQHEASEIYKDMQHHMQKWLQSVQTKTNKTKTEYRTRIREHSKKYIKDEPKIAKRQIESAMGEQLKSFDDTVNKMVSAATKNWKAKHDKIYERVLAYHTKITNTAVDRFKTREKTIAKFFKAINKRISNFTSEYQKSLIEIAHRNVSKYRQLQFSIFGLNSTTDASTHIGETIHAAQRNYQSLLWDDVTDKVASYRNRLIRYRDDLVKTYRTSYQLVTCEGKLKFDKKKYSDFCKELGEWWKFDKTNEDGKFEYSDYEMLWKEPEYKNLISGETCDDDDPVKKFRELASQQEENAMEKANGVFTSWKKKWSNIHAKAVREYYKVVGERHQFLLDAFKARLLCRYGFWSARFQERYNSYKKRLLRKQMSETSEYKKTLLGRMQNGWVRFLGNLDKYESTVKSLVQKAIESYRACMETRDNEIDKYEKFLIAKRDTDEKKLSNNLLEIGLKRYNRYKGFLSSYHGKSWDKSVTELWSLFKQKVNDEIEAIRDRFYDYWKRMLPKLIHHYECTYKCKTKAEVECPEYKYDIKWKIVNPTADTYPFHLDYYKKYRDYTLRKRKGKYCWSK